MKITVPMPSLNRPAGLLSVLTALDALASGKHEITYVPLIDADDELTRLQVDDWMVQGMLPHNTHIRCAPRAGTISARVNAAMREFPADTYCPLPDDGHPMTQHWDEYFAGLHAQAVPAFAWVEKNDPGNPTFIALSHRWVEAIGGFSEYFPFWFADTWIAEVHALAFAKGIGIIQQLQMGGKRGVTQGMRDLGFWFEFFDRTRTERIAQAERLAKAHGFTVDVRKERAEILASLEESSRNQLARVPIYEKSFHADQGEPSAQYLEVKRIAEAWA